MTIVAVLALATAGAPAGEARAQSRDLKAQFFSRYLNRPAPQFALKDTSGKVVHLSDYRGKVVLLNFWFSACFPCRQETPDLVALHRQYHSDGLVILGINTDRLVTPDDDGTMRRKFIDTYRIPYPVLVADLETYRAYGQAPVQPISFLIDRAGTIVEIFWGAYPGQAFDRAVRPRLAAAPPPAARPSSAAGSSK
jgi:peroxiredoxin